jgi:hypothetical protein
MVNNPNSVPPTGGGKPTNGPEGTEKKPKHTGNYQFTSEHHFLGMTFSASDWNKLMNIMLNNMNNYINQTFQKMTKKLKKDWARERGEIPDD